MNTQQRMKCGDRLRAMLEEDPNEDFRVVRSRYAYATQKLCLLDAGKDAWIDTGHRYEFVLPRRDWLYALAEQVLEKQGAKNEHRRS